MGPRHQQVQAMRSHLKRLPDDSKVARIGTKIYNSAHSQASCIAHQNILCIYIYIYHDYKMYKYIVIIGLCICSLIYFSPARNVLQLAIIFVIFKVWWIQLASDKDCGQTSTVPHASNEKTNKDSRDRQGCTPIPTYPYGKSLYKPYISRI